MWDCQCGLQSQNIQRKVKFHIKHKLPGNQNAVAESISLALLFKQQINEPIHCTYWLMRIDPKVLRHVYMSLIARKAVFGVCDQGRLKLASAATEAK